MGERERERQREIERERERERGSARVCGLFLLIMPKKAETQECKNGFFSQFGMINHCILICIANLELFPLLGGLFIARAALLFL